MLPCKNRVGKQYFPASHQQARSVFSDLFTLKAVPSKDRGSLARFAVVVSVKVAKQAVTRNKLKRRVYVAVRTSGGLMRRGATFIFYAKKGAGNAPYSQVADEVAKLLSIQNKQNPR